MHNPQTSNSRPACARADRSLLTYRCSMKERREMASFLPSRPRHSLNCHSGSMPSPDASLTRNCTGTRSVVFPQTRHGRVAPSGCCMGLRFPDEASLRPRPLARCTRYAAAKIRARLCVTQILADAHVRTRTGSSRRPTCCNGDALDAIDAQSIRPSCPMSASAVRRSIAASFASA